jgi:hypothetical protein
VQVLTFVIYIAGILTIFTDVYFRVVTIDPLAFALTCVTTGGPATQVWWTRYGYGIGGEKTQHVLDYENATYLNEIVINTYMYLLAGKYSFYSSNAVTRQVSSTFTLLDLGMLTEVHMHACIIKLSPEVKTDTTTEYMPLVLLIDY